MNGRRSVSHVITPILHVIDTFGPGGAETVCAELAEGLDSTRFRSTVALLGEGWLLTRLASENIDAHVLPSSDGPLDVRYLRGLMTLTRRSRARVIQAHLLTASLYGALVGRLLRVPVVATFHGHGDVLGNDRWGALKLSTIGAGASRTVFVSHALRSHFLASQRFGRSRSRVIHNGIDTDAFAPSPNSALKQAMCLPPDAILVGAVGNVRPAKGYDQLLRVAARLRTHVPPIHFLIVGEELPGLSDSLNALRDQLSLHERVHFAGFRHDIADVLNGLDIYLSTSSSEGFSLTTVQAMACALPVVATRSGGPQEIVTPGVDGTLVPVGDVDGIANALSYFALHPDDRRRTGEAGRQTALQRFGLDRMLRSYESVYDEIIGRT